MLRGPWKWANITFLGIQYSFFFPVQLWHFTCPNPKCGFYWKKSESALFSAEVRKPSLGCLNVVWMSSLGVLLWLCCPGMLSLLRADDEERCPVAILRLLVTFSHSTCGCLLQRRLPLREGLLPGWTVVCIWIVLGKGYSPHQDSALVPSCLFFSRNWKCLGVLSSWI